MIIFLEKHRVIATLLTVLIALEIFIFSSIVFAPPSGSRNISIVSIIYHFSVFFLFAFFLLVSIKGKNEIRKHHIIITIIISILYAILDEIHQSFVPSRNASMFDIMINTFGILASTILYSYASKKSASANNL